MLCPFSARCVPYSQQACEDAVTNLGLKFGDPDGSDFAGDYATKGCFTYHSGTQYHNYAFYGTGGTDEQIKGSLTGNKYRPIGYDCSNGKL